jgi:hypothetical protein
MQLVFTDVLIAENYALGHNVPIDSGKNIAAHLYAEIFAKYHITKQEYFRSYDFYTHHPDLFEKTMDPIIDSLNAMEVRMPKIKATIPTVLPSVIPLPDKNQPGPKNIRMSPPVKVR